MDGCVPLHLAIGTLTEPEQEILGRALYRVCYVSKKPFANVFVVRFQSDENSYQGWMVVSVYSAANQLHQETRVLIDLDGIPPGDTYHFQRAVDSALDRTGVKL